MLGNLLRGGGDAHPLPSELLLAFSLPAEKQLRLPQGYEMLGTWRFLTHHIRRYPHDLRAHAQRILLTQDEKLNDRAAGSLLDVFIALGGAGAQLRGRLLQAVENVLGDTEKAYFNDLLQSGSALGQSYLWRKGSVLTTGQASKTAPLVVIERSQTAAEYSNVMEEVFACLEYGQVDTARDLLEKEMLAGSTDAAVEQELLNIYQYTRDRERLDAMMKYMNDSGREISAAWEAMQQESRNW